MRIGINPTKMVIFFGVGGPEPNDIKYGGTGFLVTDREQGTHIPFLITCRHVAEHLSKYQSFITRVNQRGGGAQTFTFEYGMLNWIYHPDPTVDVAGALVWILPGALDIVHGDVSEEPFLAKSDEVQWGDAISLIGLFRLHAGKQKNVPFVHSGHIAVLPDKSERVPIRNRVTKELDLAEVYLVEAQTLDGLSGSPVFLHESVEIGVPERGVARRVFGNVRLLGVYGGSWDGEPGVVLAADRDFRGNVRVPVGVGIVTPIEKVIELIRSDGMKKGREEARVAVLKMSGPLEELYASLRKQQEEGK